MTKGRVNRKVWIQVFMAALLTVLPAGQGVGAQEARAGAFKVFDGTVYRGRPDLRQFGMDPIDILYAGRFWPDKRSARARARGELPQEATVRRLAREAKGRPGPVVIDIEHWPLGGPEGPVNLAKYVTVLQWLRDEVPGLNLGFFDRLPMDGYQWVLEGRHSGDYRRWLQENRQRGKLAPFVDAVYPPLYTRYPDRKAWLHYARTTLRAARRYGRPVYAFLWPQYSERNAALGGQYLSPDYWRLQLETVRRYADGVVIWGGWDSEHGRPAVWNGAADWWRVTRQFLESITKPGLRGRETPGGGPKIPRP